MKKNTIILTIVFAFLCLGGFVSNAEAAKSDFNSENKAIFDKKYAELKTVCTNGIGPNCEWSIHQADVQSLWAWERCRSNMSECEWAQNIAIDFLNKAMDVCRQEQLLEYPVSMIVQKQPTLDSKAVSLNSKK